MSKWTPGPCSTIETGHHAHARVVLVWTPSLVPPQVGARLVAWPCSMRYDDRLFGWYVNADGPPREKVWHVRGFGTSALEGLSPVAAAPGMYDALKALVESPNTFPSHDKARAEELLARINGEPQ